MTSLGVVVPAFHPDVDRLNTYLEALHSKLSPHVLRVELDAADAETQEAVASFDLPVEVHSVPYRRGKGAAITEGFESLDTDRLAFVDADGSTPAAELARIVAKLGAADVAVGSRRHPDARVVGHQTFARRFLGDGFAWLARRLLDAELYDYQCGAKALSADAWSRVRSHLYESGFAWDIELVAMAAAIGLEIEEVPIEWEDMPGSTVDPISTSLSLGAALLAARHRAKRLQDSRIHGAIAATREGSLPLVERERADDGGR
ncbi:glycosyltransferase [Natronomonas salina]|uniref:glycosyltransferase n=1 Tax=Natronomonas salina TaxID=1710540 RepID=UPI0015B6A5D6|nr:glycosyltransferase [Natronomonas salina]QLD88536.1 glycosyltransferase [Natronomonas salina]